MLVHRGCVAVELGRGEDGEGACGGFRGSVQTRCLQDGFELAGAYYGVDFRDVGADFIAVALNEAAGDDEALGAAAVGDLVLNHLEDGVDGFLLGGVDEGAGVDDEDVGVFGAGGKLGASAMEQAHHDLGINEVLGAAERDEAYRGSGRGGFWRMGLGGGAVFESGGQAHEVHFSSFGVLFRVEGAMRRLKGEGQCELL